MSKWHKTHAKSRIFGCMSKMINPRSQTASGFIVSRLWSPGSQSDYSPEGPLSAPPPPSFAPGLQVNTTEQTWLSWYSHDTWYVSTSHISISKKNLSFASSFFLRLSSCGGRAIASFACPLLPTQTLLPLWDSSRWPSNHEGCSYLGSRDRTCADTTKKKKATVFFWSTETL